jgi:hypothetical protein
MRPELPKMAGMAEALGIIQTIVSTAPAGFAFVHVHTFPSEQSRTPYTRSVLPIPDLDPDLPNSQCPVHFHGFGFWRALEKHLFLVRENPSG